MTEPETIKKLSKEQVTPITEEELNATHACVKAHRAGMTEQEIEALLENAIEEKQNKDEIRYAISKQVPNMQYIQTPYGEIELDPEMVEAVQEAVERVLYKRIDERPTVDTMVVELADVQREQLDKMSDLTGKLDDSLVQIIFDWGFEPMADMARLIKTDNPH